MTLIYFILVLSITILIHELGHFLFAKKAGIYVYEFSLGMGPRIFHFKRKNDETVYAIRLFPIGGFVSMAGEDIESDDAVPAEKQMCNKPWFQRFMTISAGVLFNFILAIVLLFIVALIHGTPATKPYIDTLDSAYPIASTQITSGDLITEINGKKIRSMDRLLLELQIHTGETLAITVRHENGEIETVSVNPVLTEEDGVKGYRYGFTLKNETKTGILPAIQYAFVKTGSLMEQMGMIVGYLLTGKLSLDNLAGPIGIFQIVGDTAKAGFINLLYLIAYLCINVGFINFIPLPAFDGGRLLFLIIEKIKGSRISPKVENTIHSIGFLLLMILMVFITYHDIIRLFH